jgi:uncharacterized protein YndB with AHSA1/START domain
MTSTVVTPNQDAVISEIHIAAPPERVFRALTDAGQQMQWWNNDACTISLFEMDARVGGKWRFKSADPTGKLEVNGVRDFEAHGEIVELDPPRLLAYTWIANWHDKPERSSLVRWELTSAANGTRVKVTHSGLTEQPVARKDYSGGWVGVLDLLQKYCEQKS